MNKPVLLAAGLSRDRAELVNHFCTMKFEDKKFCIMQKKNSNKWSLYVSGKIGFNKNLNNIKDYVEELLK